MGLMRKALLAGSQSAFLRERAPRYAFVRRAVSRFMPGETLDDALAAGASLRADGIVAIVTQLGENVADPAAARAVADHYVAALDRIRQRGLDVLASIKLTHLGLDLGYELARENLSRIVAHAGDRLLWIDMEGSAYVERTLELFRGVRRERANVGLCLQSYLRRTPADLESLLPFGPAIRLVKGAYLEPPELAFPRKADVDEAYFALARRLLSPEARAQGAFAGFGTHDPRLIRRVELELERVSAPARSYEFELLYGIRRDEQQRLARAGRPVRVLIAYGSYWFPWYMRRLAERPANVLFVLRNLVGG